MKNKIPWWKLAKEEGRICRMCHEPVAKATWKDKQMDHMCQWCWQREDAIDRRLGTRSLGKV